MDISFHRSCYESNRPSASMHATEHTEYPTLRHVMWDPKIWQDISAEHHLEPTQIPTWLQVLLGHCSSLADTQGNQKKPEESKRNWDCGLCKRGPCSSPCFFTVKSEAQLSRAHQTELIKKQHTEHGEVLGLWMSWQEGGAGLNFG